MKPRPRRRDHFTEAKDIRALAGPRMRSFPFHIWCRATIESGQASPELLAAAERARREWA